MVNKIGEWFNRFNGFKRFKRFNSGVHHKRVELFEPIKPIQLYWCGRKWHQISSAATFDVVEVLEVQK
jgi:hypothetical protein